MTTMDFWASVMLTATAVAPVHVRQLVAEAELRRGAATYDTGSIAESEALLLMALAERLRARVVLEVGTFIGTSTTAMAAASTVEAVYTCDVSNDCLPSSVAIRTYPKQTSTTMLRDLVKRGVQADLCFFDGVLNDVDVALLMRVTHPETVYAVHDYTYGPKIRTKRGVVTHEIMPRKGIGNIRLLQPLLSAHRLVEPMTDTTIAVLVPM